MFVFSDLTCILRQGRRRELGTDIATHRYHLAPHRADGLSHDKLAGWAQFFGASLALLVTYLTAFAPTWTRRRQLLNSADRLLLNGYEVVESYHRTSQHFLPFPLSLRAAAMTMTGVSNDIGRFPIFELDDQGSNSRARRLSATGLLLSAIALFLEDRAQELETRDATEEDREMIRELVGDRMNQLAAMVRGEVQTRPEWPNPKAAP